jgi:Caspase domain
MLQRIIAAVFLIAISCPLRAGVFVFSTGENRSVDSTAKQLEFATKDAEEFAKTMRRVGDVPEKNIYLQKNVSLGDFTRMLETSIGRIEAEVVAKTSSAVNKVVFFFSGHADERGFHFPDGFFSRRDLDHFLDRLPVRTKVVIIDSCFSGTLLGKGIKSAEGFGLPKMNFDEPTGSIYLSATSASEFAYESKKLHGGLFSKSIIDGLYGAADGNGDGVVTATELYEYSFRETQITSQLLPTPASQKPEFRSELNGRGAIALSFPAVAQGDLRLTQEVAGRLKFYAANGVGTFEHVKSKGSDAILTLPAGKYRRQVNDGKRTGSTDVNVKPRSTALITGPDLAWNAPRSLRSEDVSSRGIDPIVARKNSDSRKLSVGFEGGITFGTKGSYGALRMATQTESGILFPMFTFSGNEFRTPEGPSATAVDERDPGLARHAYGLSFGGRVPLYNFASKTDGVNALLQVGDKVINSQKRQTEPKSEYGVPFVRAGIEVDFWDQGFFASVSDEKFLGQERINFVTVALGAQHLF